MTNGHFQQLGPLLPLANHLVEHLTEGRRVQTDLAAEEHEFGDATVALGHCRTTEIGHASRLEEQINQLVRPGAFRKA
jgi:hypothetical protein